jgi:uncharacterized protein YkwD
MYRRTFAALSMVPLADCADVVAGDAEPREAERLAVERINDVRREAGVGAVTRATTLVEAARAHSEDMAERDYYAHETPEGAGPADRVPCDAVGENLHRGDLGPESTTDAKTFNTRDGAELAAFLVRDWRLSDSHRQNLVNPQWTRAGVGIHIDSANNFFATAVFC